MPQIRCFHCKGHHTSIQMVKDCSVSKPGSGHQVQLLKQLADAKAKIESSTPLQDWKDGQAAAYEKYPTLVPTAAAPTKHVPAHRVAKLAAMTVTVPAPVIAVVPAPVVVAKTGQDLELGMYQVGDIIYKVKFNKAGTHKMAEKLVISNKEIWDNETSTWKTVPKGKFYYAYGMMSQLTSENKMTEEQAKAFHDATKAKYGQDYGFCCVCGKLLTNKKSIAKGIGPICGGSF